MKKQIKDISNTFSTRCRSKYLSIEGLHHLVIHGFIAYEDLPRKVQHRFDAHLKDYVKRLERKKSEVHD